MLRGFTAGRRRMSVAVVFILGVLSMAAGCGKAEFEYVANTDEKTYFKVPATWTQVDPSPIDAYWFGTPGSAEAMLRKAQAWTVAYDSASTPTVYHLLTPYPTASPVVFSMVEHIPEAERGMVSLDYLRNKVYPVTADLREYADKTDQGMPGFELLYDQVLTPSNGIHGVRVVYNYLFTTEITSAVHTFDVTALANNDSSVVYLLVLRCTAVCYQQRAAEFDGIATSFTVGNKA